MLFGKGKLMKINNIDSNISFKGPLDGIFTSVLRTCDMNEMVNAVGLDVGAMVIPRAYYDTTHRNEYAGAETFFREVSGTFINCLSAGVFAKLISKVITDRVMPEIKLSSDTWYSYDSLNTLKTAWDKSGNLEEYTKTVLENISGRDGHKINEFKDIDWKNIEWIDEKRWDKIKWKNPEYKNIQEKLTTQKGFEETLVKLIKDNNLHVNDKKQVLEIMDARLTNALKAGRDTRLTIGENVLNSKIENILRDACDMGKDIFTTKNKAEIEKAIQKATKINKIKAFGAISLSCILGLTNQYINRKITEKRTGKKGFVGDVDFTDNERGAQKEDKWLLAKKIGASVLMAGMVFSVMGVKNAKDFARKLEFTGNITSGNAIKTVYASTIIGRFMAADNDTELRESMTRDILGFLNWLVFGGFAAKGVANMLDKKGENLFNYTKKGKGIKHWLNDMSLKTHNEIAAKGKDFAKKNMWKLNVAHASGIAYSAITLGLLLPMLNAKITESKAKKQKELVA